MLSFKPTFSLSSFTFIRRLLSSSSLSAIRVVSSAYLRLLIFLPAILIPACASSSPAFLMMYSAYKLNKQGDNIQPWRAPFPVWNQSVVPCPVLTVASWAAYRFLRRQVRWSGQGPWPSSTQILRMLDSIHGAVAAWSISSHWARGWCSLHTLERTAARWRALQVPRPRSLLSAMRVTVDTRVMAAGICTWNLEKKRSKHPRSWASASSLVSPSHLLDSCSYPC